jgi:hypothetical protein
MVTGLSQFEGLWNRHLHGISAFRYGLWLGGNLLGRTEPVRAIVGGVKALSLVSAAIDVKDLFVTRQAYKDNKAIGNTHGMRHACLMGALLVSDIGDLVETYAAGMSMITGIPETPFYSALGLLKIPLVITVLTRDILVIRETKALQSKLDEIKTVDDMKRVTDELFAAPAVEEAILNKEVVGLLRRINTSATTAIKEGISVNPSSLTDVERAKAFLGRKITLQRWNFVANVSTGISIGMFMANVGPILVALALSLVGASIRQGVCTKHSQNAQSLS